MFALFGKWLITIGGVSLVLALFGRAAASSGHVFMPLALRADETGVSRYSAWSAPLALAPGDQELWVVNPDAGTVSVVDTARLETVAEIEVGLEPWAIALAPDGAAAYVICRGSGELVIVDVAQRSVTGRLFVGPQPGGIALTADGEWAYVPVTAAHSVAVVDTRQQTITTQIPVAPLPYAVAIDESTMDGEEPHDGEPHGAARIFVTHLLAVPREGGREVTNDGHVGLVTILHHARDSAPRQMALAADSHGFPNLLSGIMLAGGRAWVPHVRSAPAAPLGLTTTVFAAVLALDLDAEREDTHARLLLNDEVIFGSPVNNPVAAIPSPVDKRLYIVLAGSNLIQVVDVAEPAHPKLVKFLATGDNPRGMVISRDGRRGYVINFLSRSITILDLAGLQVEAELAVTAETLAPDVLRGKILFNNAANPRLSQGSWISCASCHPDGGADGVTWSMPDGPRQTIPLWNARHTLPWHWSATLDEPQDVEATIHFLQHGLGLAAGQDPPLLGAPNAGRSADLDALAAYLLDGISLPTLPPSEHADEGRHLFVQAGCATCHGGPHWTISALPGPPGTLDPDGHGMVRAVLHDVGTFNPADVRGVEGFDVPSLLGVGLTAPYFHDGSMLSLEALLASGHPDPTGMGNGLAADEIDALASFLRSIDINTTPISQ